jgi:hypothetical protein
MGLMNPVDRRRKMRYGLSMYISQAQYAQIRKVTPQRINALVKAGRIPVNEKKQVHLEEAERILNGDLHPSWPSKQEQLAIVTQHSAQAADAEVAEGTSFRDAKTRSEEIKAKLAEMEYEQRLGMLVPKQEVLDAMVTSGRNIRQVIENIVNWADDIAALTGTAPLEIRKFLAAKKRELQQAVADRLNVSGEEPVKAGHGDA